jgi:site-specific DNA recombinase
LNERAVAPLRHDTADEFPLRGFVTCDCCGSALTAYWAKGRNRPYPYYECFNKQCDERRKSIRKDVLEEEFEALIGQMRPSAGLMSTLAAMFRDIWNNRAQVLESKNKTQKHALLGLNATIGKLTDRLIETTSASAIRAYEAKLEKLEVEKTLIVENIAQKPNMNKDFDESFRTAMNFLANPWKLWTSPNPDHRKTLIKLVFATPLPYQRNHGFRTAKTTSPFKVLEQIKERDCKMADTEGFEPSIELLTLYSLSRGAPSATRPSVRTRALISEIGFDMDRSENQWLNQPLSQRQKLIIFQLENHLRG